MTANPSPRNARDAMAALTADELFGPPLNGASPQRLFKKHKVLPHPKQESYSSLRGTAARAPGRKHQLLNDGGLARDAGSQPSSPQLPLRRRPRRTESGPDLPPTPPAHSRTSSSGKSVPPSSPTYVQTPEQSTESVRSKPPSTPKNQMSPPTPDVTPPQTGTAAALRSATARPMISERMPSKATTVDSRTESFKTARENPTDDEEEEDGKSMLRPVLPSARTSQSTVRQAASDGKKDPRAVGLGLGLESSPGNLTPRAKREFTAFDGEWGSPGGEVEQEWDDNLDRNVTVKKRRAPAYTNGARGDEVIEDNIVSPTNAAKALRSMALPERILTFPSPGESLDRPTPLVATEPGVSEPSLGAEARRFSGMSSKSTVSTVVEAILVDTPPRRRKTLRHVKKQITLRDSGSDPSPPSSVPTSLSHDDAGQRRKPNGKPNGVRQGSVASTGTATSISSGKTRREIWRNGGIPVVIVPDRRSSTKSSSKEPSLRSTSSRRSKRSQSVSSVPLSQLSRSKDLTPYFERPPRRGRASSESDGSTPGDQRTMDYPPIVPRRTSSLSAPTSRNGSRSGSRSGSLTADSLQAHNALQTQMRAQQPKPAPATPSLRPKPPEVKLEPAPPVETSKLVNGVENGSGSGQSPRRLHSDPHSDAVLGRRLTVHSTPFSQVSVETTATSHQSHAELSEAMAVNIYPHQNTSVLVVDHAHRLSSGSDETQKAKPAIQKDKPLPALPPDTEATAKTARLAAAGPLTPPQPQFSMDDVDSPLRNPREPPEPPAIKFIPATPSGLTPAQEKQTMLGNYFEEMGPKPSRSLSLVRQALGRRRHSEYGPSASRTGFLTRTLSLTRSMRKGSGEHARSAHGDTRSGDGYPGPERAPADEARLHPFWRPSSWYLGADDDLVRDADEETYRYPPIDNRPLLPRRSLSSRMKRTFAILPLKPDEEDYPATSTDYPDRRTVRRTPSGNLRVVKHRGSLDSLPQRRAEETRPYTAPENQRRRPFWQAHPLSRQTSLKEVGDGKWGRILPTIGNKIEEYGIHTIPRRLSERRREKRTKELRQKISGPREVRDGVGDVIRRSSYRDAYTQAQPV